MITLTPKKAEPARTIDHKSRKCGATRSPANRCCGRWFSYRKANRERPIIGDRRPPSPLGDIQPDHWLAEYTAELLNVLHVIGWLVGLEPLQAKLLRRVCSGRTISADELRAEGALAPLASPIRGTGPADVREHPTLFDEPPSRTA
jgi:hypothetical protein